jgi:23S rRNA (cytosine1962-C5)-methyltransferase
MGWRLVFAEADFLPGLVMDVFGPVLVAQVNSAASEMVIRELVQHATELLPHLHTAVIRRDSPAREAEDLPIHQSSGWHSLGSHQEATAEGLRQPIPVRMDGGSVLLADVSSGQKTGLFLDQRLNRQLVAPLARGRTVLDMHCHVGGWSLALLAAGAQAALGVDASSQAVELARQSAVLPANQPFGRHAQFEHGDDSEWLKAAVEAGRKFEVVIIDPPALAKANRHVPAALRNHTSLARHALRLIPPGGFLVHACCSQAISPQQLDEALIDAAGREGISVHLIQRLSQPPDHPILLGHPASEYLKGVVLRRSG